MTNSSIQHGGNGGGKHEHSTTYSTRSQVASHPFGLIQPALGIELFPPLEPGEVAITFGWNSKNVNDLYGGLTFSGRTDRFNRVNIIAGYWPGIDVTLWFPELLQPRGLPSNPLDWSGLYLFWFGELAKVTKGNMVLGHYFLEQVALDKGGASDAKLGSLDVKDAYEMCCVASGRTSAMTEQGVGQLATPPSSPTPGSQIRDVGQGVVQRRQHGDAMDIDEKPQSSAMGASGWPTEEKVPRNRLKRGRAIVTHVERKVTEYEVSIGQHENRQIACLGVVDLQDYYLVEGIETSQPSNKKRRKM